MSNVIGIKKVNKEVEFAEVNEKYMTECVKSIICSFPDKVIMHSDKTGSLFCLVDEEGLPKKLPINFLLETNLSNFPIQKMVGTAIFMRVKPLGYDPYDYEIDTLTPKDVEQIRFTLDFKYQTKLKERFVDYGKGFINIEEIDEHMLKKMFGIN